MKQEIELFKALSDETRIRIMKLLSASKKPICVCEIVDSLTLPQYLISRHLNILRRAGLIEDSRDGTWVSYSVPHQPMPLVGQLIEAIKECLEGPVFEQDRKRLKLRLRLRQNGRCVIGYDNQKFSKLIRKLEKSNERS
jgi:ArsR family transcriptional regulator